jgi:hypothetical protein
MKFLRLIIIIFTMIIGIYFSIINNYIISILSIIFLLDMINTSYYYNYMCKYKSKYISMKFNLIKNKNNI